MTVRRGWTIAYWLLSGAFALSAGLNLLHIRGGFLTNHLADVVVPAWLYVVVRGLAPGTASSSGPSRRFGRTPELAAGLIFAGSAVTEISQWFWPRGPFSGRFDPMDLLAFAAGVLACYAAERRLGTTVSIESEPGL